jgi:starch phosphorylase
MVEELNGNTDGSIVAYFSMEIAIDPRLPTYSGGLGVLAGDTLRAAADLGLQMVGITLLHRKGYFQQHLDEQGNQSETPNEWSPEATLEALPATATVSIEGQPVRVRAWRYVYHGVRGTNVPVLFLDTSLPDNEPRHRALTDYLYGGDAHYRLCQEVVLGLGGVAMLRALGYEQVQAYHMNEGHSALLGLALLQEQTAERGLAAATDDDKEAVRRHCVFTTHTPVPAGHDRFAEAIVKEVLGADLSEGLRVIGGWDDGEFNTTYLALLLSHYVNGVAMRHGQVSRGMFPQYPISSITNGVHANTWTAGPFQELFDRHITDWRADNLKLRYAVGIPRAEVRSAHVRTKQELLAEVERRTGQRLDPESMTVGFARRAATYKRTDLLFSDPERLRRIAREVGPLQFIYAGKAHPHDEGGKAMIRRVFEAKHVLGSEVPIVYLEDYDMVLARSLCAGVDLWLNTPQKPQEASGTSGMKAALNGVPSLSVLDGWWIEGCVEGVTGWSIGDRWEEEADSHKEVASMYEKLERVIVPMFYGKPLAFARVMRSAIALNGSFFNAQRMLFQYMQNAYRASETSEDQQA